MVEFKITLKELILGFKKYKSVLRKIENESSMFFELPIEEDRMYWSQTGVARTIMELSNDKYFDDRIGHADMNVIKQYRK